MAEAEPGAAEQLIGYLEAAVADSVEQKGVGRSVDGVELINELTYQHVFSRVATDCSVQTNELTFNSPHLFFCLLQI